MSFLSVYLSLLINPARAELDFCFSGLSENFLDFSTNYFTL